MNFVTIFRPNYLGHPQVLLEVSRKEDLVTSRFVWVVIKKNIYYHNQGESVTGKFL